MHTLRRRQFLKQSSLLSLTAFPAAFSALGANIRHADGRILVVIQLSGGNDGLNTVIPYTDAGYAKHRNELKLASDALIKIDDEVDIKMQFDFRKIYQTLVSDWLGVQAPLSLSKFSGLPLFV